MHSTGIIYVNECYDYIYSFGIVMWEIWSRELPFFQYSFNYQVENAVMRGERPAMPTTAHLKYNSLMETCWQHDPTLRPSFSVILEQLEYLRSDRSVSV